MSRQYKPSLVNWQHPLVLALGGRGGLRAFWSAKRGVWLDHTSALIPVNGAGAAVAPDVEDLVLSLSGGSTGVATASAVPLYQPSLPVTIMARIRVKSLASLNTVFCNAYHATNYTGVNLYVLTTGAVYAEYGDAAGGAASNRRSAFGDVLLAANQWYDIAVVLRGATDISIYVDKVLNASTYTGTGGALAYTGASGPRFGTVSTFATPQGNVNLEYLMMVAGGVSVPVMRQVQTDPYALLRPSKSVQYAAIVIGDPDGSGELANASTITASNELIIYDAGSGAEVSGASVVEGVGSYGEAVVGELHAGILLKGGQLQALDAVPSAAVNGSYPPFSGSLARSVDGKTYVESIGASAVPSTAIKSGGMAYHPNGRLYVTTDAPSGATLFQGIAIRSDGAVHVSTAAVAATDTISGGLARSSSGQVRMSIA